MNTTYDSETQEARSAIPPTHIHVSLLGSGSSAHVFLCIPRAIVFANPHPDTANLRKNLVAVKVQSHSVPAEDATREHDILSHIRSQAPTELQTCFPRLIEAGPTSSGSGEEQYRWLVLEALCPAITLPQFQGEAPEEGIPREMAAKLFLDIGKALEYLHAEIKVTHNDLQPMNVMLRTATTGVGRLPHFVLIDFAGATSVKDTSQDFGGDVVNFLIMVSEMIRRKSSLPVGASEQPEWKGFETFVGRQRVGTLAGELYIADIVGKFSIYASGIAAGATQATLDTVTGMIDRAAQNGRGTVSDQYLSDVADRARRGVM